jgi:hypothetical protein
MVETLRDLHSSIEGSFDIATVVELQKIISSTDTNFTSLLKEKLLSTHTSILDRLALTDTVKVVRVRKVNPSFSLRLAFEDEEIHEPQPVTNREKVIAEQVVITSNTLFVATLLERLGIKDTIKALTLILK